jgi:hypothetical protein
VYAKISCLPVHWRHTAHLPNAGGLFGTIKSTDLIHERTRICACIQDQNTDRCIQMCTECRTQECRCACIRDQKCISACIEDKIQADIYRYAPDKAVHMSMYSEKKYSLIHADMHFLMSFEYIRHTCTYAQDTAHMNL